MKNKSNNKYILLLIICLCLSFSGFSQQKVLKSKASFTYKKSPIDGVIKCATTENEERLQIKNPSRMNNSQFEKWLTPIIEVQKQKNLNSRTEATTYTIPVVIHIIHNGDAVNTSISHTSENISDAQAASQITVLNQDFRRIANTPGYGTTNYNRGVDCQINFVLAKQDPFGVFTTGIEHLNMLEANWTEAKIEEILKPDTQWDPTQYLNLWTVQFSDTKLLGYAQFPSNSNLGGLNTNGGNANTDGAVINYITFGSRAENDGSFELNKNFNLGRTTTHELGHYLGLRHIWGDDNLCTGDNSDSGDYASDTPDSTAPNYSCVVATNCIGFDMIENYMDYTNDACMNTFTDGQKTRMTAVMTSSPRRKELPSSNAFTSGFTKTLDAAVRNISITTSACNSGFTPSFYIENKGTTNLFTAVITYSIDNSNSKSFDWNGSLPQNTSTLINIPEIVIPSGTHLFNTTISSVNNNPDLNALNNSTSKNFTIAPLSQLSGNTTPKITLTLQCDRDGTETSWTLRNRIGTTIYSGGPYTDTDSSTNLNLPITEVFNLQDAECYTFTIFDSYGDGINTNGGVGSYSLKDENNTVFASGGTFLYNESKGFNFGTLSNSSFETSSEIYLYPNPVNESLKINVPSFYGLPNRYIIIDNLGKTINKKIIQSEADLLVNTTALSNGIYYIILIKGDEKKTLQFIKE
ncbi:M43 family zinc metalloprotease [Flavobacterium sp.]|uniref:M43 family zinc metalloprotease n=1 Tax=Flavobacterium sp. TaxID=239 RepID=UPI0038FC39D3